MDKYSKLPKLKFTDGKRDMISVRLPGDLIKELEKIVKTTGWSMTAVVHLALDEYAQWATRKGTKYR